MKLLFLHLAALGSAFVWPDQQLFSSDSLRRETSEAIDSVAQYVSSKSETFDALEEASDQAEDKLHGAFDHITADIWTKYYQYSPGSHEDIESDLEQDIKNTEAAIDEWNTQWFDFSACTPAFWIPWASDHDKNPEKTIYELLSTNKNTRKLAKIISKYDDLVVLLNGTAANYTVFAPTDEALAHLPHPHDPPKELIETVLQYHVSPECYPLGRILQSRTIPSLFKPFHLGKGNLPQRLSTSIGLFSGTKINYVTQITSTNKFATNGVVHFVNTPILPPPRRHTIVDLLPEYFSTFQLGLLKTGVWGNGTNGGTVFVPSNDAFEKLGPLLNGFLFSEPGLKYLEAVLRYHIAPYATLYSDAYYSPSATFVYNLPKGKYHIDLPTLLHGRTLSIDIRRVGRLLDWKINGHRRVSSPDVVADDGVIHVLSGVLLPPKKLNDNSYDEWDGETEMTIDELKERLDPYLTTDDEADWEEL